LKRIRELPATGVPLGIKENAHFPIASTVVLEPGDVLLIGTDGVWEAKNPRGEMFGTGRLSQVLATWSEKSASDIYNAVTNKVKNFCIGELQDDMTLMVIKVLT
jgi:sigma-B regulation protein RsbU (phosphoserine phosphatase)